MKKAKRGRSPASAMCRSERNVFVVDGLLRNIRHVFGNRELIFGVEEQDVGNDDVKAISWISGLCAYHTRPTTATKYFPGLSLRKW